MTIRKTTLNDVSKLAQVSIATVSYVINGTKPVSDSTREKVLDAIHKLGYFPDLRARSLKTSRVKNLNVLFPYSDEITTSSRYFRDIIASICVTAGAADYQVIISQIYRNKSLERQVEKCYGSGMAGGIILVGLSPDEAQVSTKVLEGFPTILLSASVADPSISFIDVDNKGGISQAVQYLVNLGHRRIAYVNSIQTDSHSIQRLNSYRDAMKLNGLYNCIQVYDLPIKVDESTSLDALFNNLPTAVIAFDDFRALHVYSYLIKRGIRIPEDVSLIGFDDEYFAQHMSPSLSSIAQPFNEMGTLAAKKLIELIENSLEKPFRYVFPMNIIVRESCGIPRNSNRGLK